VVDGGREKGRGRRDRVTESVGERRGERRGWKGKERKRMERGREK
jgi:hypothetical protein